MFSNIRDKQQGDSIIDRIDVVDLCCQHLKVGLNIANKSIEIYRIDCVKSIYL